MTDAKKLLPCPFCCGEAKHSRFTGNGFTRPRVEYSKVWCPDCLITTDALQLLSTEDRAIIRWNTRPSPDNAGLVAAKGRALISALDHKEIGDKVAEAGATHWKGIQIAATELDEAIAALSSPIDREAVLRTAYDAAIKFIDSNIADPDLSEEMARNWIDLSEKRAALSRTEQEGE